MNLMNFTCRVLEYEIYSENGVQIFQTTEFLLEISDFLNENTSGRIKTVGCAKKFTIKHQAKGKLEVLRAICSLEVFF